MRNAVRALIWWGKGEMGVREVVVAVFEDNLKSRKVEEGLEEFVRVESMDEWVEWPAVKGGGMRKALFWRWMG
jgi:RimJ/RimL family protein N-acetyltransferase